LCFSDKYTVETKNGGVLSTFIVTTESGDNPFVLLTEHFEPSDGHGTRLTTAVTRNLPNPTKIRNILSSRFLADPNFKVIVNGETAPLAEHKGLMDQRVIEIQEGLSVEAYFLELKSSSGRFLQNGVAFWVGGRLVGSPTWTLKDRVLIDGRTRLAKKHAVIIKADQLIDLILSDWTAFKQSEIVDKVFSAVGDYVENMIREVASERVEQTRVQVLSEHKDSLERLKPLARYEVESLLTDITSEHPTLNHETVSLAVEAIIRLEQSRSGSELLLKLSRLSDGDIEGLNRLLSEWTVRDALTVLDEIDNRISVIEALEMLASDPKVDELNTLHPLVTQARWLFGPEFDSSEYASNVSLRNAVKIVLKKRLTSESFKNSRRRPDLVILEDSTLSITGTEGFEDENTLIQLQSVLIIELKRGGSTIGRDEMAQATDYVEEILSCGAFDGTPFIHAFVVGHRKDDKTQHTRKIGDPVKGIIFATTFGQLVRTAGKRLFNLREKLAEHYMTLPRSELIDRVLSQPKQLEIPAD